MNFWAAGGNGSIELAGGGYRLILAPNPEHMPLATLGKLASRQFAEWTVGFITTDERLAQASGLAFTRSSPPLPHGGLRVKLYLREAAATSASTRRVS